MKPPRLQIPLRLSQLFRGTSVLIDFFRATLIERSMFGFKLLFKFMIQTSNTKESWKIIENDLIEFRNFGLSHSGDLSEYEETCHEHYKYRRSRLHDSLIIGNDFTKYIGHLGFGLATRIYMQMMNYSRIPKTLILYSQTSNQHLLENYFGKYFSILKFSEPVYELLNLTDSVRFEKPAYIFTEELALETTKAQACFAEYVYEYQRSSGENFPGIFTLDEDDIRFKNSLLQQFGFEEHQSFVTVHLKQPSLGSLRGVKGRSFIPVIEYILDKGMVVFYLGEADELPNHFSGRNSFIDVTKWNDRTPRTDLVLLAKCKVALVTTSGPHTIPGLFGVPTLWTNAVGLPRYLFFPQCTFIPKLFIKNDEIVSVTDMVKNPRLFFVDDFNSNRDLLHHQEITLLDNTGEDILAVFQELELTKYYPTYGQETENLERKLGRRTSVLSRRFAQDHSNWLS